MTGCRLLWIAGLAVAVTVFVTAYPSAASAQAADPCVLARALRDAGATKEARAAYIAILRRAPTTPCARVGLKRLNTPVPTPPKPSCATADDKFEQGDLAGARTEYAAVGEAECGAKGLVAVREVERLCAQGRYYDSRNRDKDAETAYKAALEKSPNADCATAGLGDQPSRITRFFNWIGKKLDGLVDLIPKLLAALGILLTLLFVILLLGYFRRLYRRFIRFPIIGGILGPRLTLGPLDDAGLDCKVGAPMTARIKERLHRFREEALRGAAPDYELDLASSVDEFADLVSGNSGLKNALDQAQDISDRTKVVAAVLDLLYALLPIRRLAVTGVLEPPDPSGARATLSLERDGRLESAVTLRGPVLASNPTSVDYLRLSQPAAVWLQYEVARVLRGDKTVEPDEAESYALVRDGLDRHFEGDEEQAKIAYDQALVLNPLNWAARVNLALTEARLAQKYESAVEILEEAVADMEAEAA